MSDQLKPLTAEQAAEFEARRESAAVVQHKCSFCGSWYETAKRDKAFQEQFVCDCGEPMSFAVPAMDGIRAPTNSEILALFDPAARLDTGMSAKEALKRAGAWWERVGRRIVAAEAGKLSARAGGASTAFSTLDPESENFLPSGILAGKPWDALTKRERLAVVKVHHHFTVRKPDLIGGAEDPHRPQDRKTIN